jgi:hypothetical protein
MATERAYAADAPGCYAAAWRSSLAELVEVVAAEGPVERAAV